MKKTNVQISLHINCLRPRLQQLGLHFSFISSYVNIWLSLNLEIKWANVDELLCSLTCHKILGFSLRTANLFFFHLSSSFVP